MTQRPDLRYKPVPVSIPEKLLPLLKPWRFKIVHGGRGSAKSHTVAQLLLVIADSSFKRVLCVRESQTSIKQSSYELLKNYIEKLGMSHRWDITSTELKNLITGSVFHFIGLKDQNADSIKSYEGYDIAWIEEAQSVRGKGFKMLIDTIRKERSEIWCTFNPTLATDYVYDRFVARIDPDALVIEMNWRDNPWFTSANNIERLKDKASNDAEYNHVWEGKLRSAGGIMFKRAWFKYYLPHELPKGLRLYGASDYAVTEDLDADWTEHGVCGVASNDAMYFVDWKSYQTEPTKWIGGLTQLMIVHKPLMWFEEKGVILRAVDAVIRRLMKRQRLMQVLRYPLASAGSKKERALGFAALCSEGMVYLPLNEDGSKPDWVIRLVNQLCSFSGSPNDVDDMVDVCSLLARGLRLMLNAPEEKREGPPDGYQPVQVGDRRFREAKRYDDDDELIEQRKSRYYR
jgi:phage terminase large subunit-like protein